MGKDKPVSVRVLALMKFICDNFDNSELDELAGLIQKEKDERGRT